ncbi:hypothetical protein Gotri_002526 [Gossypium trilobum]|uniref:Uncharacterized protein n=1 Tax=Gossypium trilobum TaxID=34281 RepID=A0A7J9F8J1_9ROSI|nr:hypothetical protein [Gossypium trilobum]
MEFNSKRRGFFKGKLTPFYRAVKGVPTRQYSSKVKPNQGSSTSASISFRVHQDYMISQPKQISYIVPGDKNREKFSQIDNFFGVTGDESVDIKAATYISSVQEPQGLVEGTLRCLSIKVRMMNGGMGGGIGKRKIGISLRFRHPRLLGANRDMRSFGPYGRVTSVFQHQGEM